MCLTIDSSVKPLVFDENGYAKVYKILIKYDQHFTSVYYKHYWHIGQNKSSRKTKLLPSEKSAGIVDYGFHVFLYPGDALEDLSDGCPHEVIVELLGHEDDLISYGLWNCVPNAVFSKLTLTKEEYAKHMQK